MGAAHVVTSVVIPIRNEEAYIEQCIQSLLRQDYPVEQMEVFFVDGASTDKTCKMVQEYCGQYPHLHLLNNPDKTVPYAMNTGIKASSGHYIVRMDAHSAYADNYISQCIACLERTNADNVGGVAQTQGQGLWGNAIALMLSSKFGVGNSSFRVGAENGYVDTVPFGAFRREVFDKYGLYDNRLTRNQDNEMNYRIRKMGGKIYLSNDIQLTYFCRNSVGAIAKMGFQNGKWNIITSFLCPGTMGLRHFIPLVFVLSIVLLGLLSLGFPHMLWLYVLLAEGVCYVLASGGYALSLAMKKGMRYFLPLIGLFPLFHICYGMGSLVGFFSPITWDSGDKDKQGTAK